MRKITSLLMLLCMFVGTALAQVTSLSDLANYDLSKQMFRIKSTTAESMYLTVVSTEGTNIDAGGIQIKAKEDNSSAQAFFLVPTDEEATYKFKTIDGYYLQSFGAWGYKASANDNEEHSKHMIEEVEESVFNLKSSKGYVGTNNGATSEGSHLYSNHGSDKQNIKWAFEPLDADESTAIITVVLTQKKNEYAAWKAEMIEGDDLGEYTIDHDALDAAEQELSSAATISAVIDAIEKCKVAYVLNGLVVGKYYRIQNTKHSTYTGLDAYTCNMKNLPEDPTNPTMIWKYEQDGEKFYMKNVYAALYPQNVPSGAEKTTAIGLGKDYAFTYELYAPKTASAVAQWNIFFGGSQVNIEPSGNVNYWYQDGAHHNLYEEEITDDALVAMCVKWYEDHPYEYVAPEVTAANFQKIDIDPNATVVISPSEFAAPAEINAAIDKLAELDNTMKTPVVEDIDDIHALFAAIAGYTGAVNALNEYKSAVTSYGELLSIAYTPKAEWGTIILPINWAKPEGWTRYSCSAIEGNVLTLNEYAEGSTKNNPMIIKVEEEKVGITYQLIGYSIGAGTENVTKGLLTGVLEDATQVPTASYILADYNDVVAFYPVAEGANYAASKYKCYLTLPAAEARYSALYFEGGETAIESFEGAEAENAVVYDLSGRRVQKAQKGLYIVNGKKVVK